MGSPQEEQKEVYGDYEAINEMPGVTPLVETPEWRRPRVENGEMLTTDGPFVAVKEALGGYLVFEADDLDEAIELASRIRGPPGRRDRGAPAQGGLAILEHVFRDEWGRCSPSLIGFLGDFDLAEEAAQEAFAIAASAGRARGRRPTRARGS